MLSKSNKQQFNLLLKKYEKQVEGYKKLVEGNKRFFDHTNFPDVLDGVITKLEHLLSLSKTYNLLSDDDILAYDTVAQDAVESINAFLAQVGTYIKEEASLI